MFKNSKKFSASLLWQADLREPLKLNEKKKNYHFTCILFMNDSHLCTKIFIPWWNLNVLHILYLEENNRIVYDTLTLLQQRRHMFSEELETNLPLKIYMFKRIYMLYTKTSNEMHLFVLY